MDTPLASSASKASITCAADDPRIRFSLGTKERSSADGSFSGPQGLAFDGDRGHLFVADRANNRVQVFSCVDGSFVSKFGSAHEFNHPTGIEIDSGHDRIVVADTKGAQSWSLSKQSFVSSCAATEIASAVGIAIDQHRDRTIIVDSSSHRLVVLSSTDLSVLFVVRPGKHPNASGLAIDSERDRLIVTYPLEGRVQVLASTDGSPLFELGSDDESSELAFPRGVCIDNHGRVIVADCFSGCLRAFTPDGQHISSLEIHEDLPHEVAFDEHRGLIAFAAGNRVHVIEPNQWLPDTFTWRPDRHRYAPVAIARVVSTMTMIRSLIDESALTMMPNELLFEIFSIL